MLTILLAFPALVFAIPASTFPYAKSQDRLAFAPLHENGLEHIDNSYIVALKEGTTVEAMNAHTSFISSASLQSSGSSGMKNAYFNVLKGYAGSFDESTLALIRSSPEVEFVERDQKVWTTEVQNGAPWGLARVSHRPRLTLGTFRKYEFDGNGGEGVDAYVIDTGINIKHTSFEGRAHWGHTVPKNDVDEDGNGHGTHCAGTIASKHFGVAKNAHVIAVKVLGSNGSGSMSDVIEGVDWAATAAASKAKSIRAEEIRTGKKSNFKGSVANMSLGGGASKALDNAINAAVDGGLHLAVAAGNDNKDACKYSPAAAERAVTVGASTLQDGRAYFSNFGKCVDVFAPGLNILSTWTGDKDATNTISGTSMASPHVAGLLAYLLSLYPDERFDPLLPANIAATQPSLSSFVSQPSFFSMWSIVKSMFILTPESIVSVDEDLLRPIPGKITTGQLKKAIIALSSAGILTDVGAGSPNLLVFNNFTRAGLNWDEIMA